MDIHMLVYHATYNIHRSLYYYIIIKEIKHFNLNSVLWHLLPYHLATLTSCIGVSVYFSTLSFSLSPTSCSTYWNVYVWCVCMYICMYERAMGPHGFVLVDCQSLVYFVRSWLSSLFGCVCQEPVQGPWTGKLNYNSFFFTVPQIQNK